MEISVTGVGYVGLVSAACFAELGHHVICVDIDVNRIKQLQQGAIPFYEPGLESLVMRNDQAGRLRFTTDMKVALVHARVHFIAVGTPADEDGSADVQHVLAVADALAREMPPGHHIVVNKSTVPVGTAARVDAVIQQRLRQRGVAAEVDVVSNPEFLKEGDAINDFMSPSRVIIGSASERATECLRALYAPFTRNHERTLVMGVRDAEMTKYAANAMLATKISFMNEIAALCDHMSVDVEQVRLGIGADERIGYHFIYPGCGYGGSCFPKDVKALIHMAGQNNFRPALLEAVEWRNQRQKQCLFEKIRQYHGEDLQGMTFALWGLAFKPGTDDVREAPSLVLLENLVRAGARVAAHDPVALETARQAIPAAWLASGQVSLHRDPYAVLANADGLVLSTEWKVFRNPDYGVIRQRLKTAVIFDGRNLYDPKQVQAMGCDYIGIGRSAMRAPVKSRLLRRIA
ncbi:MAG: UDP-glucose/GDP-mannose dehydrogenase family protein [Gammaproteobacteria bacterium]